MDICSKIFISSTILALLNLSLLILIDIGLKLKTSFASNNLSLIKLISEMSICNSINSAPSFWHDFNTFQIYLNPFLLILMNKNLQIEMESKVFGSQFLLHS